MDDLDISLEDYQKSLKVDEIKSSSDVRMSVPLLN